MDQTEGKHVNDFSKLTFLLCLVRTLNLNDNLSVGPEKVDWRVRSANGDKDMTTLDAIAAILAQEHDVVAVCYNSDYLKVSIVVAETENAETFEGYNISEPGCPIFESTSTPISDPGSIAGSNPSRKLDSNVKNTHGPTLLTPGTGIWAEVRDKCQWYCAFKGPLPLSDHVVTVFTYLTEYKNLKEDEIRDHCSFHLSCYLLTTCWRKMFRRITSWQAMGLISILDKIQPNPFSFKDGPADKMLTSYLNCLADSDNAKDILSLGQDSTSGKPRLERLFSIVQSQSGKPLLSSETASEFHLLVVTALRGFATCLIGLSTEHKKLSKDEKYFLASDDDPSMTTQQKLVLTAFKKLVLHIQLLHVVVCSTSFKAYLRVLGNSYGMILFPQRDKIQEYKEYAKGLSLDDNSDSKKGSQNDARDGESAVEGESVQDEESVGHLDNVEDDEYDSNFQTKTNMPWYKREDHFFSSLNGFMKNLVVHLTATWMLQTYRLKSDQDVEVSLLTMEPFQLSIPISSWPEMSGLIETSLRHMDEESETAQVTEILRKKISDLQSGQVASKYTAVLSKFRPLITPNSTVEEISFIGGLHWQTVLMTAGKYFQDSEGVADLTSVCKNLLRSGKISVSKLCCAVCWELLLLLSEADSPLCVRSCCSTVYPVELPAWPSSDVIEKMTGRLQIRLQHELDIMLHPR